TLGAALPPRQVLPQRAPGDARRAGAPHHRGGLRSAGDPHQPPGSDPPDAHRGEHAEEAAPPPRRRSRVRDDTMDTATTIRDEVRDLASFYGLDRCPSLTALDSPLVSEYVEIVLREDQMELVLGGVGRDAEVTALAEAHGVHPEAIEAFRAVSRRVPHQT